MEEPKTKIQEGRNKKVKIILFIFFLSILVLSNLLSFGLGYFTGDKLYSTEVNKTTSHIENKESTTISEDVDFDAFWKAWTILDNKFVESNDREDAEEITDQNKIWGAISGLAKSYNDPYTNFFPPEENELFESDISGEFVGVGIEIGYRSGLLTVVSPLTDTPAFKAGMKAGDVISKIDGADSINMAPTSAVKLIRGEKGLPVVLTVIREGESAPLDIEIIRDVIKIPTIKTEKKDGVFIIKLSTFTKDSASLTKDAFVEFSKAGTDKLILDLRGNPGGLLQAAQQIASFFLKKDEVIVTSDYGKGREDTVYKSFGYNIFNDNLKFVVLIDRGSASASEILAGALRQHNKALLVGGKTFGKGSVQELVPVTDDTSLKVTIAKWILPNGDNISNEGIEPDFIVDQKLSTSTTDISLEDVDLTLDRAIELLKSDNFFDNFKLKE